MPQNSFMDSGILRVDHLHISLGGVNILKNISLEIKKGEQWAIFGKAGSGKTVFAQALAGRSGYSGSIEFISAETDHKILLVELQHTFRDLKNQSQFYYQQRYNAFDAQDTKTVNEDLYPFSTYETGNFSTKELIPIFGLQSVLQQPLIQLSNGENKRLQILKAVLADPDLLILDEPFTGLDAGGRQMLDKILGELTSSGIHLVLFSSRNQIPPCFNRFALLEKGELQLKSLASEISMENAEKEISAGAAFPVSPGFDFPGFEYAVRLHDVHVLYEGKYILQGINWKIRRGDCWALTGHNGAGKSTLLSLLTGDNPQAYSNDIYLFDRKRGTGESIWEIKSKIGFVSPEMQLYFDPAATAFSTLASGFFDTTGLFRQVTAGQEELVLQWLWFLGCLEYKNRLLASLPDGLRRLLLLGRAMIKAAPVLILDEPCQGLDAAQTAFVLHMIDRYCTLYGATLIFVTHDAGDLPRSVTQTLRLEKGQMA